MQPCLPQDRETDPALRPAFWANARPWANAHEATVPHVESCWLWRGAEQMRTALHTQRAPFAARFHPVEEARLFVGG